jgi:GGDEF domain-containing protein
LPVTFDECLAIKSLDHYKGFEVGDRLLVAVVLIIRKLIAKSDLFSRIGSDEFCLFIKNKTADEVRQFAERKVA